MSRMVSGLTRAIKRINVGLDSYSNESLSANKSNDFSSPDQNPMPREGDDVVSGRQRAFSTPYVRIFNDTSLLSHFPTASNATSGVDGVSTNAINDIGDIGEIGVSPAFSDTNLYTNLVMGDKRYRLLNIANSPQKGFLHYPMETSTEADVDEGDWEEEATDYFSPLMYESTGSGNKLLPRRSLPIPISPGRTKRKALNTSNSLSSPPLPSRNGLADVLVNSRPSSPVTYVSHIPSPIIRRSEFTEHSATSSPTRSNHNIPPKSGSLKSMVGPGPGFFSSVSLDSLPTWAAEIVAINPLLSPLTTANNNRSVETTVVFYLIE